MLTTMSAAVMLRTVYIGHSLYVSSLYPSFSARCRSDMSEAQRKNEFGRHLWALKDPAKYTRMFLKILYIYIIFYYSAVVCIKFAMWVFFQQDMTQLIC